MDAGERVVTGPPTWAPAGEPPAFGGPALLAAVRAVREPLLYPEWLGDRTFAETHRTRFPYSAGEMAGGIATTGLVTELARAGMLAFFGAAGLPPARASWCTTAPPTASPPSQVRHYAFDDGTLLRWADTPWGRARLVWRRPGRGGPVS